TMVLSGAERARRCREKKKATGLSEIMKKKDRDQELVIFSDGSASQFKQRYLLKNLSFLAKKFDIQLSWQFFASHHGKVIDQYI
ncbi:unnamed protein product, partial [Rotaria sp. Silwood2]